MMWFKRVLTLLVLVSFHSVVSSPAMADEYAEKAAEEDKRLREYADKVDAGLSENVNKLRKTVETYNTEAMKTFRLLREATNRKTQAEPLSQLNSEYRSKLGKNTNRRNRALEIKSPTEAWEQERTTLLQEYAQRHRELVLAAVKDQKEGDDRLLKTLEEALAAQTTALAALRTELEGQQQKFKLDVQGATPGLARPVSRTLPFPIMNMSWSDIRRDLFLSYQVALDAKPVPASEEEAIFTDLSDLFKNNGRSKNWGLDDKGNILWKKQLLGITFKTRTQQESKDENPAPPEMQKLLTQKMLSVIALVQQGRSLPDLSEIDTVRVLMIPVDERGQDLDGRDARYKPAQSVLSAVAWGSQYGLRDVKRIGESQLSVPGVGVIGVTFVYKDSENNFQYLRQLSEATYERMQIRWKETLDKVFDLKTPLLNEAVIAKLLEVPEPPPLDPPTPPDTKTDNP